MDSLRLRGCCGKGIEEEEFVIGIGFFGGG